MPARRGAIVLKAGTAAHSRTSCSGETPVSDGANSRASSSGSGRRSGSSSGESAATAQMPSAWLARVSATHPPRLIPTTATRLWIDARLRRQPLERHTGIRNQVGECILAARAPRAAVVNVQAVHTPIAQVDGQVEVLLVPGYAVQQQYCRAPIRAGSAMQCAQDPAPAG